MICPICSNALENRFQAQVLGKYQAQYEHCNECGFLRAQDPFWLPEAYTRAIANADTGLVVRNVTLTNKISRLLYWVLDERGNGHYLDFAGGYGMLTRMMRDNGFNFYWSDKYCENLIAPGFEYKDSLIPCLAVTAIEVLEHVTDPAAFVREALNTANSSIIIFTTELYKDAPPNPDDWWYYSFATGQHIAFFKEKTLEKLADNLGLNFVSANGIHIFSKNPINQFVFKIVTNSYFSLFTTFFIRYFLGSKTLEDHRLMMKKIDNRENKNDL